MSCAVGLFTGGGALYSLKGDVISAQTDGQDAKDYAVKIEVESKERDARIEKKVEQLADLAQKNLVFLERIDERTLEIKRRQDMLQK
jgi:hypothetical protein